MAVQTEVKGIVLSSFPQGETDKRIVLLTKELGRITAFARGAKRTASPLLAPTRTFAFGKFTVYPGRSAYTLSRAEITDYFEEIVTDMEKTAYGCSFMDLAAMFSRENTDEEETLRLLYYSLKALSHPKMDHRLVQRIFELKLLKINGLLPDFSSCVICRKPVREGVFIPGLLQTVCTDCRGDRKGIHLSRSALYALSFIALREPERLFSFVLSEEVLQEICEVTDTLLRVSWEKEPESRKMLEVLAK